jgi:hypothetical protein
VTEHDSTGRNQREPGTEVREILDAVIMQAMRRGEPILNERGLQELQERYPFRRDAV